MKSKLNQLVDSAAHLLLTIENIIIEPPDAACDELREQIEALSVKARVLACEHGTPEAVLPLFRKLDDAETAAFIKHATENDPPNGVYNSIIHHPVCCDTWAQRGFKEVAK